MDQVAWRRTIEGRLESLRTPPNDDLSFHVMTLTSGGRSFPCTKWIGWADDDARIELRVADVVDAGFAITLGTVGMDPLFVVDVPGILLFIVSGGAALIERSVAETFYPELLEPISCVKLGARGFTSSSTVPDSAFSRAPSQKLRMAILKRDGYRCAVCGRRAADHVDVELEVHHVRPWGSGGVTHDLNLLTLCRTCHRGLDPHFDPALFNLIDGNADFRHADFSRATLDYRGRVDREMALT